MPERFRAIRHPPFVDRNPPVGNDSAVNELASRLSADYRRALLLTGHRGYAAEALAAACVSFPDVSRAAAARFDARLAALCRPRRGRTPEDVFSGGAGDLWRAAAALPPTDLELWMLARVEGFDEARLALVFDLPRDFIGANLRAADDRLRGAVGSAMKGAVGELRSATAGADASGAVRRAMDAMARARRRRRVRAAVTLAAFIGVLAVAAYVLLDLMAWRNPAGGRDALPLKENPLSVPKPSGAGSGTVN